MNNFAELAARCEKLTAPSFALDQEIARLDFYREANGDCADNEVPAFTESVDDAMTLIPEGYWTTLDHFCMSDIPGKTKWRTFLNRHFEIGDRDYLQKSLAVALTPALAICAAALRARGVALPRPHCTTPETL